MNKNDFELLDNVLNFKAKVYAAQQYIKENYGVDSEYTEDEHSLTLSVENINEALELVTAKEYLENKFKNYLEIKF